MISGTAYGVVLNARDEVERLASALTTAPYMAAPAAPVVYIKPRTCFSMFGAPVGLEPDVEAVSLGATLGLLFGADACGVDDRAALGRVAAACLAVDVTVPHVSYYRPALAERCRDGFLPLGRFGRLPGDGAEIVTTVDDRVVHRWTLDRLVRPMASLIADLSTFMTLRAGDLLLVGLPGDAPTVRRGQSVTVSCSGLPSLTCTIEDAP